jgi:hypothetical protein
MHSKFTLTLLSFVQILTLILIRIAALFGSITLLKTAFNHSLLDVLINEIYLTKPYIITNLISVIASSLLFVTFNKFRIGPNPLSLAPKPTYFFKGMAVSSVTVICLVLIFLIIGDFQIEAIQIPHFEPYLLAFYLSKSLWEAFFYQGFLIYVLNKRYTLGYSILVSSLIFSLIRIYREPNLHIALTAFLLNFLLCLVTDRTRTLSATVGFRWGWSIVPLLLFDTHPSDSFITLRVVMSSQLNGGLYDSVTDGSTAIAILLLLILIALSMRSPDERLELYR